MEHRYDLLVIGAGPAGISAAIFAARARLRTLVIDSGEHGGQIRITNEVVNYPGIPSISGAQLSDVMRRQAEDFGARLLHANIRKVSLDGDWKRVETDRGDFEALSVIIATGSRPRMAGFAGEREYMGRGVGYCATCDGEFFTGLEVFVVGGGLSAAEEAIFLTRYARKVTMLVRGDELHCPDSVAEQVRAHPRIELKLRHEILEVSGDRVLGRAVIRDNESYEAHSYIPPDGETFGVFVFVGYEPLSEFVRGQVELDAQGYIPTDPEMATNLPGVFAAGDIRPKKLRQLVTAVSDGAVASTAAERFVKDARLRLGLGEVQGGPRGAAKPGGLVDDELRSQLAPVFARFERDVWLAVLPGGDGAVEGEMRELLAALEPLSPHVRLPAPDDLPEDASDGHRPCIELRDHERRPVGIRYAMVPGGHEFNSFVLALYNLAGPGQPVPDETLAAIRALDGDLKVQVAVTLSCTMCPDVVQACQLIALHNPRVAVEVVDISRDEAFRTRHGLMSVPALVINGSDVSFGKKSLPELVQRLRQSVAAVEPSV